MTRADQSKQPTRETPYRRLYTRIYKFEDNAKRQDDCIGYLLNEIRMLQKRMDQMEQQRANPPPANAGLDLKTLDAVRKLGKRYNLR